MLTYQQLVELERSHRDAKVLSVYIDGEVRDPAERGAWRTLLDDALTRLHDSNLVRSASHEDREAFDQCVRHLRDELAPVHGALRAPGWVGFFTREGAVYADGLPVPMPTAVWWGDGLRVAAALRALKELRPAIVAIVDSRMARLYRYRGAMLERLETLRAHERDVPSHPGAPPRSGFQTGVRGTTATDAVQRELRAGRERMMSELAERMTELASPDGWLLIGGTSEVAKEAQDSLGKEEAARSLPVPEIDSWSRESEIAHVAAEGAATLRRREDLAAIRELLDQAGARGRGAARWEQTWHALEAHAAHRLFMTMAFIEAHPGEAESAVRAAFDQDADVEVVSGEGAELLDRDAQGIGALLRYPAQQG